ncbi:hypothetical protein S7711_11386 [Stachybotrys chartarum IBT 7711]|uniref:Uncharacterized protein n=1 Tax=Stachybotrys chartarum (strain CBS 109288 / IBT 7711) TaxID=1280523 RepID=A0A084BCF6_STACB|nr:hypothetical protein S7711_11386 [Stachybotrys chartarum IBT 7711]
MWLSVCHATLRGCASFLPVKVSSLRTRAFCLPSHFFYGHRARCCSYHPTRPSLRTLATVFVVPGRDRMPFSSWLGGGAPGTIDHGVRAVASAVRPLRSLERQAVYEINYIGRVRTVLRDLDSASAATMLRPLRPHPHLGLDGGRSLASPPGAPLVVGFILLLTSRSSIVSGDVKG